MAQESGSETEVRDGKRLTLRHVAAQAGVSLSTASRVARGAPSVRPGRPPPGPSRRSSALGYEPDTAARSIRTGQSHVIGYLVADIANPFFAAVVKGAAPSFEAEGYALVLASAGNDVGGRGASASLAPCASCRRPRPFRGGRGGASPRVARGTGAIRASRPGGGRPLGRRRPVGSRDRDRPGRRPSRCARAQGDRVRRREHAPVRHARAGGRVPGRVLRVRSHGRAGARRDGGDRAGGQPSRRRRAAVRRSPSHGADRRELRPPRRSARRAAQPGAPRAGRPLARRLRRPRPVPARSSPPRRDRTRSRGARPGGSAFAPGAARGSRCRPPDRRAAADRLRQARQHRAAPSRGQLSEAPAEPGRGLDGATGRDELAQVGAERPAELVRHRGERAERGIREPRAGLRGRARREPRACRSRGRCARSTKAIVSARNAATPSPSITS